MAEQPLEILVVDDESALRETLKRSFALEGHHVVAVADGDSAIDRASSRRYDVLLLDVALGAGPTGYEVATAFYASAGPLIARDGRPVMVLTSVHNRPIVPVARLADAVHRGQVRFILMVGACGRKPLGSLSGCPPSWRWARAHSVDVSKQAGLPGRGLLFRFTQHQ